MINLIKEKFEECKETKSFIRINAEHPIDTYVGYNERGYKTLAIVAYGEIEEIESTKLIEAKILKRTADDRLSLSFSLLDDMMSDIFYQFCDDIVQKTVNLSNKINSISFIIERWKKWIQMFKNPHSTIMSENEIRGLLGELVFLKEIMIKKYGISKSLESWIGSSMSHKDFEIDDMWYELKAIRENAITVEISSIEQLESKLYGELVLVKLEPSNLAITNPISLNDYIKSIEKMLEDKNQMDLFYKKLEERNYFYTEEYDEYVYANKGIEKYKVIEGFPRINNNELKDGIVRVSYQIYINKMKDFFVVGD